MMFGKVDLHTTWETEGTLIWARGLQKLRNKSTHKLSSKDKYNEINMTCDAKETMDKLSERQE